MEELTLIPKCGDDMTSKWFEAVLNYRRERKNLKVRHFKLIAPKNDSGGYLSAIYQAKVGTVTVDDNGAVSDEAELALVIKVNSRQDFFHGYALRTRSYEKETFFYTKLIPTLNQFTDASGASPLPICHWYYVETSPDGSENIVVLDDLTVQGFRSSIHFGVNGLSLGVTKAVFESIAYLHATALAYQRSQQYSSNSTEAIGADYRKYCYPQNDFVVNATKMLGNSEDGDEGLNPIDVAIRHSGEKALDLLEAIVRQTVNEDIETEKLANRINIVKRNIAKCLQHGFDKDDSVSEPIVTLTHGDLKPGNIMYRIDDSGQIDIRFIDWQMIRQAPVASDLNYMLFTSCTTQLRRDHTTELLKVYAKALLEHGEKLGCNPKMLLQYSPEDRKIQQPKDTSEPSNEELERCFKIVKRQYYDTILNGWLWGNTQTQLSSAPNADNFVEGGEQIDFIQMVTQKLTRGDGLTVAWRNALVNLAKELLDFDDHPIFKGNMN